MEFKIVQKASATKKMYIFCKMDEYSRFQPPHLVRRFPLLKLPNERAFERFSWDRSPKVTNCLRSGLRLLKKITQAILSSGRNSRELMYRQIYVSFWWFYSVTLLPIVRSAGASGERLEVL
jgi:hypothetical protein